jgi:type VI secretion system FHA domain protein
MSSPLLILTLTNERAEVAETRVMKGGVLSIGRSPTANWVVRDGRLSRVHCEIRLSEDGNCLVIDQSKNGVFWNASPKPIGRGASAPLRHGDVIAIGSHRISIAFDPPPEVDDATRIAKVSPRPTLDIAPTSPVAVSQGDPFLDPVLAVPPGEPAGAEREKAGARASGRRATVDVSAPLERGAGSDNELLAAFLQGAGVTLPAGSPLSHTELMRSVGETFRAAVLGIREMLLVRSSMRGQLRLIHTIVHSADNNSLKFALDDEHALQGLLSAPRPGKLAGPDAMRQSIRDLTAHEQMMMDVMRAGQDWILARLAPDEIRNLLQHSGRASGVLPGLRKARYWDEYVRAYRRLKQSLEADPVGGVRAALNDAYDGTISQQ